MASVSNITFGREASKRALYDPKGAQELYNSRPFQDVKPSKEMQAFTEFMYDTNFVFDLSISISTPLKNTYIKVGASKVTSPNKNLNAAYVHLGGGKATASVFPVSITYSAGFARGVNQKKTMLSIFWIQEQERFLVLTIVSGQMAQVPIVLLLAHHMAVMSDMIIIGA